MTRVMDPMGRMELVTQGKHLNQSINQRLSSITWTNILVQSVQVELEPVRGPALVAMEFVAHVGKNYV